MTEVWLRILWISGTTSIVLLPLLLCAGKISSRYQAKSCYWLWLILCLRLLLPVRIPTIEPVVTVELPQGALHPSAAQVEQVQVQPETVEFPEFGLSFVAEVTAVIWLAGMAVVLVWHAGVYDLMKRRWKRHAVAMPKDQELAQKIGSSVQVLRTTVDTPMTMGVLQPIIFLPKNIPEEDLFLILRHEICHLQRKDLWYKGLFLVCSAVHWFNPLVWRLNRVAGNNLELCCDEAVVAGENGEFRRRYGQILLRSAAGSETALTLTFGNSDLKGRIMNLFMTKRRGILLVCVTAFSTLSMGSLVGCDMASAKGAVPTLTETEVMPELSTELAGAEPEATEEWLWPIDGEYQISLPYGSRVHPITGQTMAHSGMDISAETGTPVLAAEDGTVIQSAFDQKLGNYVLIDHGDEWLTLYGCLKETEVLAGDTVRQGNRIGTVGQTGQATGPHLHLEVRDSQGDFYDPMTWYSDIEWTVK